MADCFFFREFNGNCVIFVVNNIGIWNETCFVIHNHIDTVYIDFAVLVSVPLVCDRQRYFAIDVCNAFFHIVHVADCNDGYACLRTAVLVGDGDNDRIFLCGLYAVR